MKSLDEKRAWLNTLGINTLKRLVLRIVDSPEADDIKSVLNFLTNKNREIAEEGRICMKRQQQKTKH